MGKYRVEISAPALQDLREIVGYIGFELAAPAAALEMLSTIEEAINNLTDMPKRNALVTDKRLARQGFRKMLIKNYLVFYRVTEKPATIEIVRVLYARRSWVHLL